MQARAAELGSTGTGGTVGRSPSLPLVGHLRRRRAARRLHMARDMDSTLLGQRCRTVRLVMHPSGPIPRATGGVVRSEIENIGRRLLRVDLDGGRSLILLADDISLEVPAEDEPVAVDA
jgi:hypothetical protein